MEEEIEKKIEDKKKKILENAFVKDIPLGDSAFFSIVLMHSIDKLRASTERSSDIANKLSRRILWLNLILAVATIVGTLAAIRIAFFN